MAMAGLYRRILPSPPAIDFASSEGKKLFTEAIHNGTMEGFFKLISYFQTQSEPAYCGLASLSMVLNALAIDPGRKWKGPWRWFDENMLDCCEPLEKVKDKGISFGKVICLAHCAGADVEAFRTNQSTIDDFRKFMLVSRRQRAPSLLYTLSCKHESWITTAKYLMDDVPMLLSSDNMTDVKSVLSTVFTSLPSDFAEFIKWVAEIRRKEDGDQKTLFCMKQTSTHQDNLSNIAATVCCQGAGILTGKSSSSDRFCCRETCVSCYGAINGDKPVTVVSGTVVNGNGEQGVDMLVPLSQTDHNGCSFGSCSHSGMHPASNDVLTALLLALPPETWSRIKDEMVLEEISGLVSTESLPTLLQEEVHMFILLI
ncbi:glutathione gamma-glutamylcysteinyltransferase 1 [Phtheirospermum japonicum]|uniref:glutathione gamma-glutamylcysteinyltransferase n=1 Tax=Phtheirospermum japonicum TaxID=374723 RepID=A0A830BCT7_9LAMI|nr:glutathione gamma-glutamylcysteinyltransferase 1 [Phtheirospermum japonicum]